jgi:imidazolonepropionase-like amidohydrolase
MNLQKLSHALEEATNTLAENKKATAKAEDADKETEKSPKPAQKLINALLNGEKTLLAHVERASDILVLLALKDKYKLDLVLVGASDAGLVADDIAKANVAVMTSALDNLPNSFDSLHNSLTNLAKLQAAGVKVIISNSGESHNINLLRFDAGIAVTNGLSKADALAAVTANVADIFKLNTGRISVGKNADLVLWSADPFEISTKVDHLWINGKAITTHSRQDALRKRYTTKSTMPRAYTK